MFTFRLETKSAVSSRVSLLIWSTISAILGFAAAASVELYRLVVHDTRSICAEDREEVADRNWRAQLRAANRHGRAIVLLVRGIGCNSQFVGYSLKSLALVRCPALKFFESFSLPGSWRVLIGPEIRSAECPSLMHPCARLGKKKLAGSHIKKKKS